MTTRQQRRPEPGTGWAICTGCGQKVRVFLPLDQVHITCMKGNAHPDSKPRKMRVAREAAECARMLEQVKARRRK